MNIQIHNNYLISIELPILEELQIWKESIIKHFYNKNNKNPLHKDIYLGPSDFPELRDKLLPKIDYAASKLFYNLDNTWGYPNDGLHAYIQSNEGWKDREEILSSPWNYHNHIQKGVSIAGVCYLSLPQVGGEFQTMHPPTWYGDIIMPELNRFYFFPGWLYHRPLPQQDKDFRICINWSRHGITKPVLKRTNLQW